MNSSGATPTASTTASGGTAGDAPFEFDGDAADAAGRREIEVTDPDAPQAVWGSGVLAIGALAWLAATLWSAQATIGGSPAADPFALTRAALALPGVIAASLLAGGATGLAVVELLSRRVARIRERVLVAAATGLASGLAVGALVAAAILLRYGTDRTIVVIAVAIATAAALGGVPAAVRPAAVIGAGFAGTLAWYAVGLLQGLFASSLLRLFGAGDTIRSQVDATNRLSFAVALLGGVVSGVVAYRYLYRRGERRWPAYLIAGAAPGVLILLAEAVTLLGGAGLLELAGSVSAYDRFAIRVLGFFRIKTGLLVLFAGGVVAILAFGRSLPAPSLGGTAGSLSGPAGSLDGPAGSLSRPAGSLDGPAGSLSRPAGSLGGPGDDDEPSYDDPGDEQRDDDEPADDAPAGPRVHRYDIRAADERDRRAAGDPDGPGSPEHPRTSTDSAQRPGSGRDGGTTPGLAED
jgi:hypothetical protein